MRFALLLPLWLVLAIGEPSLVHSCPMHGAAGLQHGSGDPHAAHAGHAPVDSRPEAPPPTHNCSCIGTCTMGAGAVVPPVAVALVAGVSFVEPLSPATRVQHARYEADRLLPYPNGPPPSPDRTV